MTYKELLVGTAIIYVHNIGLFFNQQHFKAQLGFQSV